MMTDDTVGADDRAEIAALIRDSAEGYIAGAGGLARARAAMAPAAPFNGAAWSDMAALGWNGMLAPEAAGGGGLGLAEAVALHEQLGRGLIPEPLAMCAHLPALALRRCDSPAARAMLADIVAGAAPVAVAWQPDAGALSVESVALKVEGEIGRQRLSGAAAFVVGAGVAETLLVAARSANGVGLYRVGASAQGVRRMPQRLVDGTETATVLFDDVALEADDRAAAPGDGALALERALEETRVILAAELLGVMRETLDRTLDYLRARKQFGRAIGSYQALQHRAVDLYVQIELTVAALGVAVDQMAAGEDPKGAALAASALKARAGDAAALVAREAIQMHGAIAYTQEYDIGLFVVRALTTGALLGNAATHRGRYARLATQSFDA